MSKTHKCKVTKAFVHEGKIRVPGSIVTLSEALAKPLLEAGKVVLSKSDDADEAKPAKKPAGKTAAKTDEAATKD